MLFLKEMVELTCPLVDHERVDYKMLQRQPKVDHLEVEELGVEFLVDLSVCIRNPTAVLKIRQNLIEIV